MIIVAGTIEMDPEKVTTFSELAQRTMAATEAEDGCVSYAFAVKLGAPGTIVVAEMWESEEALTSHFGQPHMAEFIGAMGEFGITATSINKYNADEGEKLM
ncbi:MAG: putative quinol monooxygenase [Acidimicrobiales bacterium]